MSSIPGPGRQTPTEQRVELLVGARQLVLDEALRMLRGDETRIDVETARANRQIVVTAAKRYAAHFADAQSAAFRAELARVLLEHDDAVRHRLDLITLATAGAVVEPQHRAVTAAEILLERQDLAAVADRVLRDEPQLGQRIDDEPLGAVLVRRCDERLRRLAELELRWAEYRQQRIGGKIAFRRHELRDVDSRKIPAVALCDFFELGARFRERDIEARFVSLDSFEKKLNRERRLAGARRARDEQHAVARETAAQDVIESRDAGAGMQLRSSFVH